MLTHKVEQQCMSSVELCKIIQNSEHIVSELCITMLKDHHGLLKGQKDQIYAQTWTRFVKDM